MCLEFLGGMFLANGCRILCRGSVGIRFQSPFAKPPGQGDSSPVVNVVWGFGNLVAGALLLHFFWPSGDAGWAGWTAVGAGTLFLAMAMAMHFGKVRAGKQ